MASREQSTPYMEYILTAGLVKQFIRNVRASKTIADERAVVQKESAAIRASFREESGDANVRYDVAYVLSTSTVKLTT